MWGFPDPREDPKSRSTNSGMQYSYCVEYRTLRWIYFLDPPRDLGCRALLYLVLQV